MELSETARPSAEEVSAAMERLFPVDSTSHTARILGMQKRSVDRMQTGYSSCPPRIVNKITAQANLRDEFLTELHAVIEKGIASGMHPLVARYAIFDLIKGGRFDGEHEPI